MGDDLGVPRWLEKPGVAVFVSGVTSMGLQILALRVVAPQYGNSIYTIGSVITVFLAALSLGYWRGGQRSDAHASTDRLLWLCLFTAVYVAIVIVGRDALLSTTSTLNLDPRYASLPAVILLFGPPTYLLGFISPYAAELSYKDGIGEASGHVYAIGTIGSILGTAGTTFVLIPAFDVDQIGLFFGALLIATAVMLALPSPSRIHLVSIGVVAVCLVASVAVPAAGITVQGEVVYQEDTQYQHLEVIDRGDTRTMYLDGARHSAIDLEDPDRHVFAYTRYFHLPYLYADDPDDIERVLFIGGGGYTGPQSFVDRDENVTVDVVELDPAVTEAAEEYFGLEHTDRLSTTTHDGRVYLEETDETYDAIILDAFRMDTVPYWMATAEFFEVVDDQLADDGVLVANVIAAPSGPAAEFYHAQYRTISTVFDQVDAYPTADTDEIQNIQLVATGSSEGVTESALRERNDERAISIDLADELDTRTQSVDADDAPIVRDDDASVDALLDPMLGQRYVIDETDPREDPVEPANPVAVP